MSVNGDSNPNPSGPVRAGHCRDPKDYRFCGYAEAVAGNKRAREGLGGVIVRSSWREVSREYRMVLWSRCHE